MKTQKKTESASRLRVVDRKEYISIFDIFDGNNFFDVKEALDKLEALVAYGQGEEAKFNVEPYGYDGGVELYMEIYRDETDAEYNNRMEKNAKTKEKARLAREKKKEAARKVLMESEAAERAEYERLRVKFEG